MGYDLFYGGGFASAGSDSGAGKRMESCIRTDRSILHPQLFVNGIESAINLLTPSLRRCPHLGCALKWNPSEHTWDCPCHGSRFGGDGSLIDNPAKHDAKV